MPKQAVLKMIYLLITLCILTLPFYLFNIDINFQKLLYDSSKGGWFLSNNSIVQLLYKYGTYPAIILSVAAILAFAMSFGYKKIIKHRKSALFLILLVLIGPGLIVNVIFKSYSGRPRPREIVEFGGGWHNKKPFELGTPGKGASFPCGHASAGFALAGLYFIMRRKQKNASRYVLGTALIYGTAMGIGRSMQGAHFLSDTLWAGGFVMLTGEALYGLMRMGEEEKENEKKVRPLLSYALAFVLLMAAALFFLMATPFFKQVKDGFKTAANSIIINIESEESDIVIAGKAVEELTCEIKANGFGLPKSDCKAYYNFRMEGEKAKMDAAFRLYGLFTEFNAIQNWILPAGREYEYNVTVKNGNVYFEPEGAQTVSNMKISAQDGDVHLTFSDELILKDKAIIEILAPRGKIFFKNKSGFFREMTDDAGRYAKAKEVIGRNQGVSVRLMSKEIVMEPSK